MRNAWQAILQCIEITYDLDFLKDVLEFQSALGSVQFQNQRVRILSLSLLFYLLLAIMYDIFLQILGCYHSFSVHFFPALLCLP